MTEWERRKREEITAKLESLRTDLEHWSSRSEERSPLEKHHSQIRRLERDFLPVAGRLVAEAKVDTVAERWRLLERAAQDLLSVWGYFRDKLALRLVPDYSRYLAAADDFAWACYRPALLAAEGGKVDRAAVREPALTCLEDVGSPFSIVRGSSYEGELSAAPGLSASSRGLLRRLPVPIIALPWFQLQHLPDALVIAHEVGHHVFNDLGMAEEVGQALRVAPGAARSAWAEEMFCDVFGTVRAGSAFVMSLADFLRVADVTADASDNYPPTSTRLAVCLAALELDDIGSVDVAHTLRTNWAAEGLHIPTDAAATAASVAKTMATTRFTNLGATLVELEAFTAGLELHKDEDATELLALRSTKTRDVRVLLAAAATAFVSKPEIYRTREVGNSVLEAAQSIREPGVRGSFAAASADEPAPPTALDTEPDMLFDFLMRDEP
jgi:hypothetical protein